MKGTRAAAVAAVTPCMDRARDVLIGSSQSGSMSTQPLPYNDGNGSVGTTIEIHRRLFGYRQATPHLNFEPSKASVTSSQACGSRSYKGKGKHRLMSSAAWRPARTEKSCTICLKWKPWAVERMRGLAKIGLGLPAELTFDHDGDTEHISEHIHSVLVSQFTQLETCTGYRDTLQRLNDDSHDLVEIEYPSKGTNVPYLKPDILNQAKLCIRIQPALQKSITTQGDVQEVCICSYTYIRS